MYRTDDSICLSWTSRGSGQSSKVGSFAAENFSTLAGEHTRKNTYARV